MPSNVVFGSPVQCIDSRKAENRTNDKEWVSTFIEVTLDGTHGQEVYVISPDNPHLEVGAAYYLDVTFTRINPPAG